MKDILIREIFYSLQLRLAVSFKFLYIYAILEFHKKANVKNIQDFNMDDFIKFPEFVRNLQKYIWGVNSMGPEGIIMLIFVGLWVLLHAQYFIEAVKNTEIIADFWGKIKIYGRVSSE